MADIRIKDLATTAASTASDDFIAVDGSANGTRKLNAYSPTFGGNLTVSGTGTSSVGGTLTVNKIGADNTGAVGQFTGGLVIYGGAIANAPTAAGIVIDQQSGGVARIMASGASTWNVPLAVNAYGGNVLIGTTTDGGQKLQVSGTGLLSANLGGNGFVLNVNNVGGNAVLQLMGSTAASHLRTLTNGSLNLITGGTDGSLGTTALTLDSSQNATFAGRVVTSASRAGANIAQFTNTSATGDGLYLNLGSSGTARYAFYVDSSVGNIYNFDQSGNATFAGTIKPQQAATASAPSYVKGAIYFDTTLNKLRVGGATGWETITSV